MRPGLWSLLAAGVILLPPNANLIRSTEKTSEIEADEQTLLAAGLQTDGQALLEFLRGRTRLETDWDQLRNSVRQLVDPSAGVRARALAVLVTRGTLAIPVLRQAANDLADPAVAGRARHCLEMIDGPGASAIPAAAVRLLAVRKPPDAAAALLEYLPFTEDPLIAEQVAAALGTVAFTGDKPEPVLVRALSDPVPVRRAVAAEALCCTRHPELWPQIRALLRDPKPTVRLRAALALVNQRDATSIPAVIDLLADLPAAQRQQAEDALQHLAGEWAPNPGLPGDDPVSRRIRRDSWAAWWGNTDGPVLLDQLRKHTLTPAEQVDIEKKIQQLTDKSFAVREQAVTELAAYGSRAVPLLRETAKAKDLERARRADRCLQVIGQREDAALPAAAVRMIAVRRPAGAAAALLDFLPSADTEPLTGAVREALAAVAIQNGRPDPALMQALDDKVPVRRSAAAEAIIRSTWQTAAARKLLHDPDARVRLSVALALAAARDRDSIPVLIDSLTDAPAEDAWRAQEALGLIAGDKAPTAAFGPDAAARQQCRQAWSAWWRANAAAADLSRLEPSQTSLGYTLLVEIENNGGGRVLEIGRDRKPRWQIDGLQFPVDAHIVGGNRVLIAEYNGMRVTERDFKGNIIWQKQGLRSQPVNVQRLPNGNTFIATLNEMLEVDHNGREVFTRNFANLFAACKARNGEIVCLMGQGTCVRLDARGNEIKSFPSARGGGWTSGIDVLANGHILIAQPDRGQIEEFTPEGKSVWHAATPGVTSGTPLPNGHTLVASHQGQNVVELDRAGKTVWEYKDEHHIFRARRR
jgi:HEAT repeat protein